MKYTLILFTISITLSIVGCMGGVQVVGPDGALTAEDSKILKWHNKQELRLRSILTGLEEAKSDLIKAESNILGKQEILKLNISERKKLINELAVQNQMNEEKLIDLGNYINNVRQEKYYIDEEIEPIRTNLNQVSADRRQLNKKSTVTGDKILKKNTILPIVPDSKSIYNERKNSFSPLVLSIENLKVTPFINNSLKEESSNEK